MVAGSSSESSAHTKIDVDQEPHLENQVSSYPGPPDASGGAGVGLPSYGHHVSLLKPTEPSKAQPLSALPSDTPRSGEREDNGEVSFCDAAALSPAARPPYFWEKGYPGISRGGYLVWLVFGAILACYLLSQASDEARVNAWLFGRSGLRAWLFDLGRASGLLMIPQILLLCPTCLRVKNISRNSAWGFLVLVPLLGAAFAIVLAFFRPKDTPAQ